MVLGKFSIFLGFLIFNMIFYRLLKTQLQQIPKVFSFSINEYFSSILSIFINLFFIFGKIPFSVDIFDYFYLFFCIYSQACGIIIGRGVFLSAKNLKNNFLLIFFSGSFLGNFIYLLCIIFSGFLLCPFL